MKNKKIELLARAILIKKGKILVCKNKRKNYCFFPGGHVEFGESAQGALVRELKEELGLKVKKSNFIGISENFFNQDGKKHHEINLVFAVKAEKFKLQSKENHIEFFLKTEKELLKDSILPIILKKAVLKWFKIKKYFK